MNVMLGVSGGIAAYKACDIINKLKQKGHKVRVCMTDNAQKIIPQATLASLSGSPVFNDMWDEAENGDIEHINVTQKWTDLLVIAPATANCIGKLANGIADDYLTTMYMAAHCAKMICPAMNTTMLSAPAVQRNLKTLEADGVEFVNPATGTLACGTVGDGKLAPVDEIVGRICAKLQKIEIERYRAQRKSGVKTMKVRRR